MIGILATLFIDSCRAIANIKKGTTQLIHHQKEDFDNPYVDRLMDGTYLYKQTGEVVRTKHMFGRPFFETIPKYGWNKIKRYDPIGDKWKQEDEEKRKYQKQNPKPGQIAIFYRRSDPTGVNIIFEDANEYDFINKNSLKLISNKDLMYGNIYEHIQSNILLWSRFKEVQYEDKNGVNRKEVITVYINSKGKIIDYSDFDHERIDKNSDLKETVLSNIEAYNDLCCTYLCDKSHVARIGNKYDKEELEKKIEDERVWYNS